MPNIRAKGQVGEREVATLFNHWTLEVRARLGLPDLDERDYPFQRNQNQSAVGGDDLTNPYNLAIEVKRQEALAVNSWWEQCLESAARTENSIPILIYRQSRKPWQIRMRGYLAYPVANSEARTVPVDVNIDIDDLQKWYQKYLTALLMLR